MKPGVRSNTKFGIRKRLPSPKTVLADYSQQTTPSRNTNLPDSSLSTVSLVKLVLGSTSGRWSYTATKKACYPIDHEIMKLSSLHWTWLTSTTIWHSTHNALDIKFCWQHMLDRKDTEKSSALWQSLKETTKTISKTVVLHTWEWHTLIHVCSKFGCGFRQFQAHQNPSKVGLNCRLPEFVLENKAEKSYLLDLKSASNKTGFLVLHRE